jgi:predicted nucleic acid-binding protein
VRVLLDTCAVSELSRPEASPQLQAYLEGLNPRDAFLSVITIGELVRGIALLPKGRKRQRYESFLQELERTHGHHVLPIDLETARVWGELGATARSSGRTLSAPDGLIAATAIRHGLRVVTRNVKDFEGTGASIVNPWGGVEPD